MNNDNNKKITVRLNFQPVHNSLYHVFFQPLFFLAMNQKQVFMNEKVQVQAEQVQAQAEQVQAEQIQDPAEKNPKKNDQLVFNMPPNLVLEMNNSSLKEVDFQLNYIMDRYACDYEFTFKGASFLIKTDKTNKNFSFKSGHDEHNITSVYEITYNAADYAIFEDFILTSVNYFNKYSTDSKLNNNRLKLFISSTDGSYFDQFGSRPKRSLDSVFLPKKQKEDLVKEMTDFFDPLTIKRYANLGIIHKKIMLFAGKPGTGKSSLITALASHFDYNIAIVSFTPKMTDVGLMRALRSLDNDREDEQKVLFVFEDMDCIFKERKSNDESRNMVTFSGILNAFDGISTSENMWCILTTNYICNLDSALIRSSRVDKIVTFDYAVKEQIVAIYKAHTLGSAEQAEEFYEGVQDLNLKVTTSLLQQYLLKFMDKPKEANENLDEMKKMYLASNVKSDTADENLYN